MPLTLKNTGQERTKRLSDVALHDRKYDPYLYPGTSVLENLRQFAIPKY